MSTKYHKKFTTYEPMNEHQYDIFSKKSLKISAYSIYLEKIQDWDWLRNYWYVTDRILAPQQKNVEAFNRVKSSLCAYKYLHMYVYIPIYIFPHTKNQ